MVYSLNEKNAVDLNSIFIADDGICTTEKIDSLVSNEAKLNITDSDIPLYLYCAITGVYSKTFQTFPHLNIHSVEALQRRARKSAIPAVDFD